jgi:hypothetical protein
MERRCVGYSTKISTQQVAHLGRKESVSAKKMFDNIKTYIDDKFITDDKDSVTFFVKIMDDVYFDLARRGDTINALLEKNVRDANNLKCIDQYRIIHDCLGRLRMHLKQKRMLTFELPRNVLDPKIVKKKNLSEVAVYYGWTK